MTSILRVLVDGGSLSPEATLMLRAQAEALSARVGGAVTAASLDYSERVDPALLNGIGACCLDRALAEAVRLGVRCVEIQPFMVAAGGGIARNLRRKLSTFAAQNPWVRVELGRFLFDEQEAALEDFSQLVADHVIEQIEGASLKRPSVLVVDHGSPFVEATHVRNRVGTQLAGILGGRVSYVGVASMERRGGTRYAFNEPLLEHALQTPPFNQGEVVVALMFLLAGKHAGPGGDIERICQTCANGGTKVFRTRVVSEHPRLSDIVFRRYEKRRCYEPDSADGIQ